MEIRFKTEEGCLDFIAADLDRTAIRESSAWLSYRQHPGGKLQRVDISGTGSNIHDEPLLDEHGNGIRRVIQCQAGADGIKLTYRARIYPDQPFVLLQISMKNMRLDPVFLDECCLVDSSSVGGGKVELGEPGAELRFFKVGWHGWDYSGARHAKDRNTGGLIARATSLSYTNPSTRQNTPRGKFTSEGWGMLANQERCLVAGFVTTAEQFGQVYASARAGEASISLVTQLDGIRLDPGETRDSEWGYLQFIELPHPEPSCDYIQAVARQMCGRVPAQPPQAMWTHWYQFFHDITEEQFLRSLDGLADHAMTFPCSVTELDDGYQRAWGDWTSTNSKFPHGLEWLAEQIRKRGFTPGIWLAPFAVQAKSELARMHPDWLVRNERGKPASAGFLYNMFIHPVDLTNPEVLDYLRKLAHQLTQEWGYAMLKIDFLNAGAIPGRRSNPKLTRAQALRSGLEAIREGAGEETFLLGCGCPFGPAIGIVDAMRIGPDTAPSWTPYFHWMKWAGPLLTSNPNMPALRNALRNTLDLSTMHQRWWWNDPDCLLVRSEGSKLSEAEVQSMVTLAGLSGGLLVSSDDLQQVSPERLVWMSKLVPNLGLRGLPLDVFESDIPRVYRLRLGGGSQEWQVVAVFNWEDHPADVSLEFSRLGYKAGAVLHVFDFWEESYLRTGEAQIVFHDVPAHGCKLLRICEVGETPQVVGDTLHISMGAEIKELRIVNGSVDVVTVEMGRNAEGKVWVWTGDEVIEVEYKMINTKDAKDTKE